MRRYDRNPPLRKRSTVSNPGRADGASIVICLRYRDADAVINWLCDALGFERQMIAPDDSGNIEHAQLTFGNAIIMPGQPRTTTPAG
jgi:hypothetical protein